MVPGGKYRRPGPTFKGTAGLEGVGRASGGIGSPGSTSDESTIAHELTGDGRWAIVAFVRVFACRQQVVGRRCKRWEARSSTRNFPNSTSRPSYIIPNDSTAGPLAEAAVRQGEMSDQEDTGAASAAPERIVIGISFGNSNSSIAFTSKVSR
jgi:hypothetical protein